MMPVTTVNENDCGVFWENHVGSSRKSFSVKSETKSHSEESTSEREFKSRVLRPHSRHHTAPCSFSNPICYIRSPTLKALHSSIRSPRFCRTIFDTRQARDVTYELGDRGGRSGSGL